MRKWPPYSSSTATIVLTISISYSLILLETEFVKLSRGVVQVLDVSPSRAGDLEHHKKGSLSQDQIAQAHMIFSSIQRDAVDGVNGLQRSQTSAECSLSDARLTAVHFHQVSLAATRRTSAKRPGLVDLRLEVAGLLQQSLIAVYPLHLGDVIQVCRVCWVWGCWLSDCLFWWGGCAVGVLDWVLFVLELASKYPC